MGRLPRLFLTIFERTWVAGHQSLPRDHLAYCTDAHYLIFWWRSAAMTTALPWTSVGVITVYCGNPLVSTARTTAHGASTANAAVLSVATPWYQPWQPTEVRGHCHGNFRGRQTTAISTAIRGSPRYEAIATQVHGN